MTSTFPVDWPHDGPIDLAVHDLPHASSTTEWWYINAHGVTESGRNISIFASFFRIVKAQDEKTLELHHAHSMTWAITDASSGKYVSESRVDKDAPRMGLGQIERGEGTKDNRLRRAMREVLNTGKVPYPDRMFIGDVFVNEKALELDYDGNTFAKNSDGSYALHLRHERLQLGCDLTLTPRKAPIRHGENGVVRGVSGEDMFYYFMPRCDVTGKILLAAGEEKIASAQGWYDHEFGRHNKNTPKVQEDEDIGWNWCGAQLDDGSEITAYALIHGKDGRLHATRAILVAADGTRSEHGDVAFVEDKSWVSTRTFQEYPTHWRLEIPSAGLFLSIDAAMEDQEFITLISKPAFWEGRSIVTGTKHGVPVAGLGYVERSGLGDIADLDGFFQAVGKQVRKSVEALLPRRPSWDQTRDLIASPQRPQAMDGVDIEQFARTMVDPVRDITDRGGKSWRSYAALACCDVVGGDSREYVQWLAMPELMHVGSLIVDDVQDKSLVRRGGPTAHLIYGEALAINAGTACYFLGQKLLVSDKMSSADKLRIYDLYFESLRAGHAGQALDLDGLDRIMPVAVANGQGDELVRRVLAVHRLKTATPAASLARMGAVAGHGTEAQIEGVGRFFESVGLAFQIIDDVLNLRGFRGNLKARGEDIAHGKVTLPIAKAMALLDLAQRQWLWQTVQQKTNDQALIEEAIALLEQCGALQACADQAAELVEAAWQQLSPLVEDSLPKVMLRAFGWYVLERHY